MSASPMPTLFISHGSPMNAIEDTVFSRDWQALAAPVPRPRCILSISAHWVTRGIMLTRNAAPATIHDFGGFPPALYEQQYPAPGAPDFAADLARSLGARLTDDWGLDHGTWSVLRHLYPAADIPVVQLSLDGNLPHYEDHVALARQITPLREEGVLILGSGGIIHNIPYWLRHGHDPSLWEWALDFDAASVTALQAGDLDTLCALPITHPYGARAVPTPEHYLPMLYAAALRRPGEPITLSRFEPEDFSTASMRSFRIG
ncbi:MAG: 4,5-DOPA dioxygenase extradiol [Proteobacteria bacterium]|nr:4,5-DOPA dioxygenase extradiol [Pseudomonadota bacterium]HQR03323.1 4,5-DOPA dioxygenase extradiol [Rhodocyclaceae bacterium]